MSADEKNQLANMKMAQGLVIGTICTQTFVSFFFAILSLGTVPYNFVQAFITAQSYDAIMLWIKNNNLDAFSMVYGISLTSRQIGRLLNMSSNMITIFWHMVFCPIYRKGAVLAAKKIFCKVGVMKVSTIASTRNK